MAVQPLRTGCILQVSYLAIPCPDRRGRAAAVLGDMLLQEVAEPYLLFSWAHDAEHCCYRQ